MSIKKYRWYLAVLTLVVILVGTLIYFYTAKQDESYKDGTLVQVQYVSEEELV